MNKPFARRSYSNDSLRKIVMLRDSGLSFKNIADKVGLTEKQAANAHYKLQQRLVLMGTGVDGPRYIRQEYK